MPPLPVKLNVGGTVDYVFGKGLRRGQWKTSDSNIALFTKDSSTATCIK